MNIRRMGFAAIIIALIATHPARNMAAGDALTAKVERVEGSPMLVRDGNKTPLSKETVVSGGDTMETGPKDSLILKLNTGDILAVSRSTSFKLTSEKPEKPAVALDIHRGAVWAKIAKVKSADRLFTVRTPTAVAGVRGTAFSTTVESESKSWFCVCEGKLSVSRDGKEEVAKKGQAVVSDATLKKPAPDAKLLEHPGEFTRNCLRCHQGGYKRDDVY